MVYNGEIYNCNEVKHELEKMGSSFGGHSDTEVLVNAWAEWGAEGALDRLNGMFAFAVWDKKDLSLTLARDRLGEKPVYYGWSGNTFLFASELKAMHTHPDFAKRVDPRSLASFLRFGYIPAPHSIYRDIFKLEPGHLLTIPAPMERAAARQYWTVRTMAACQQGVNGMSLRAASDTLDTLLRDSVALRMAADVPVGAFLSGGVDSSLVVAMMQAQRTTRIKTFTIGFTEQTHNEADHAERIARHLGTEHTSVVVSPNDARSVIPSIPDIYDEPFADPSQIPTFLVSRLARTAVTVSLSGDGGDELFGGYREYLHGLGRWNAMRHVLPLMDLFPATGLRELLSTCKGRARKLAELRTLKDWESIHCHRVSAWKQPADVVWHATEQPTAFTEPTRWLTRANKAERMMYLDMITYLPDDILTKLDRASMSVSLEARLPLLDHRIVEFAWRLPIGFKIRRGDGKRILKSVAGRYVPIDLLERPKMGFSLPLADWLRGPLRPWAEELLNPLRLERQGILKVTPVVDAWKEHLAGRANRATELWVVLIMQAWFDRWA